MASGDNKVSTAGSTSGNRDVLGVGSSTGAGADVNSFNYSTFGSSCFSSMGMATMMSIGIFDTKFAAIARLVGATTKNDKLELEVLLAYYFSVHGTSPQTAWSEYDKPFVRSGVAYQPYELVKKVGEGSLKQFCARFSYHVKRLYSDSEEFRAALTERASRLGLDPNEGVFVVDFYGKDGSLDTSSMGAKANVRSRALRYRANNSQGVMSQSRTDEADNRLESPPVIPMGLHKSFRGDI